MYEMLIFGTGKGAADFFKMRNKQEIKVKAFIDNNCDKWGKLFEKTEIIPPNRINEYTYDYIVIASSYFNEITRQLEDLGVNSDKIRCTCMEMEYIDFIRDEYIRLYSYQYSKKIVKEMILKQLKMEMLWSLPREKAVKKLYREYSGKTLKLEKPETFDEKIQYLQLYRYGQMEANCTDKIKARDFIIGMGMEEHLPKLYATYNKAEEVNFNFLPEQFVLKVNNGAGYNIICKDKKKISYAVCRKELKRWLEEEYGKRGLEFHYARIEPRILCEEYIDYGQGNDIIDFKFHCFSGKVHTILTCTERSIGLKLNYYDTSWNPIHYEIEKLRGKVMEKPDRLNEMIAIAEKLAKPFPFVRVDLYYTNGKIYVGELTFTPMCGRIYYLTEEAQKIMGSLVNVDYC